MAALPSAVWAATAGSGQSGRPGLSRMRSVSVGHACKRGCIWGHYWGLWLGRGVSELEHLCWDVLAPVAVASLGGSQAWRGTFTPRWAKVTPKEGDGHQHPPNTHQAMTKCAGSWRQEKQQAIPAAPWPGWPVALLAPIPLCQPEGNPCQHHLGTRLAPHRVSDP